MKRINFKLVMLPIILITGVFLAPLNLIGSPIIPPLGYDEDWEDAQLQDNGWTGTFSWSGTYSCNGLYAMYESYSANNTSGSLVSPILGKIRGAHYDVLIGFDYLINGGTINFGTIDVQYSTSNSGPWTTIYTIDNSNHVVSNSCAHVNVPRFSIPSTIKGDDLYIRFNVTYATGTFDVVIDNVFVGDLCYDSNFKIPTCWGITINELTWYRGLSQWMWFKAKVGGGIGTYTWTVTGPATLVPTGSSYARYLLNATGPVTIKVKINFGSCYYEANMFDVLYDDVYWGGTPSDPWLLRICEGGIDKVEPFNVAKQKVCFGNASLGYCTPKTSSQLSDKTFSISLYPNPSNGEIWLDAKNAGRETIVKIYNTSGLLVYDQIYLNANQELINLNSMKAGVYFIRIVSGNENYSDKIIIK